MELDDNALEEKAGRTINLLIKEIIGNVLSDVIRTYQEEIIKPLNEILDIKEEAKKFEEDDLIRISFELICFAAFVIMLREAPKVITKRTLFHRTPDAEKVSHYNEKLLDHLDEYFTEHDFIKIREIIMTGINPDALEYGFAELLGAEYRLKQYSDTFIKFGMDSAIRWFTTKFAHAIEPKNFAVILPIAITYAGNTIEYVESLVKFVFSSIDNS
jgi:hypothetical protein